MMPATDPVKVRQDAQKERLFPVLCAWCGPKGKETIVNRTTLPNSHCICPECAEGHRQEVDMMHQADG